MRSADAIFHNGRIKRLDRGGPEATALAVADGRIVAVGDDTELLALAGLAPRRIDLDRRHVIPGLNDSHIHLIRARLNYNLELRWDGVPLLADAMAMLREQERGRRRRRDCASSAASANFSSRKSTFPRSPKSTPSRPRRRSSSGHSVAGAAGSCRSAARRRDDARLHRRRPLGRQARGAQPAPVRGPDGSTLGAEIAPERQ